MGCECLTQTSKTVKLSDKMVFACIREPGRPLVLTAGICYEPCSPLVQDTKDAPLKPMTSPNECIVAFVPACGIDLSKLTEDCKAVVYDDVDVYKENVNWPKDEEGNQLFSVADVEAICQGHHCCIRFLSLAGYRKAPDWVKNQNATGKKVA